MKKSISIIALGLLNILHFGSHFVQLIQSLLLIKVNRDLEDHSHCSHQHNESIADMILHNPYFNILWMIIAIYTVYVGIGDFYHHKKELEEKK